MIRCIGQPPYGKSTSDWLSPILYYKITYKYIDSLNPRGQVSVFKTLGIRSAQSSAATASKILSWLYVGGAWFYAGGAWL